MECEPLARTPQTALNFIHYENGASLFRELASRTVKFFGDWPNTAFALNCFDKYGTNVVCQLSVEVLSIVKFNEFKTGN